MTPTATTDDVASLLAWIVERLRTEYAPQKIILFGSMRTARHSLIVISICSLSKKLGIGFLIVGCVYDTCCPTPNAQYR